jgi:TolA-binding protein
MRQAIPSIAGSLFLGLVVLFSPVACTSAERAAQETYELAQFEEKQGNAEHARQLYQEVVTKHPDTSWAEKARGRLSELQPATP